MPVARIREVRVRVDRCFVSVPMVVFAAGRHRIVKHVLAMFVVNVFAFVIVFHLFVHLSVLMALGEMQPRAQRHQRTGHEQWWGDWLTH